MTHPRRSNRRLRLIAGLLLSASVLGSTANAEIAAGKLMRAESGTVLSGGLHALAARESGRRAISLPAILAPDEARTITSVDSIMIHDERVTVVLTAENASELQSELEAIGMTDLYFHDELFRASGTIPVENLFLLENLKERGLMHVQPEYMPMTNRGAVTSQADWLHEVDRVRDSVGGFSGAGQRIGTLSDSYNRLGGAAAGVTSGDLPTVTIIQEGPGSDIIDEGRAMIELMYDLAPDATYAFATAFIGGNSGFANNITALAANTAAGRCTIIVDDVFYLNEPFFQDGIIAQAITNAVTNRGVAYFSSAGNSADQAWDTISPAFMTTAAAVAANPAFNFPASTSYTWLDFDPGVGQAPFQNVTLPSGRTAQLVLQWDDPYYSPLNVRNDLDFVVVDSVTNAQVAASTDININSTEPNEYVAWTNNSGAARTYRVYIGRWIGASQPSTGAPPSRVRWVNWGANGGGSFSNIQFGNGPTISPHSGAALAMSVAATEYYAQQSFASFTAKGPATFYFAPNGTRLLVPEVRNKPDFTALQSTNTTFFYTGNDIEGDGFPNFSGTSASAPHAAAIASLVRQRYPAETPTQIYQRLKNSADTFGNPEDRVGVGLINAWKAVYGNPVPASVPYATDFEGGFLDMEWDTRRTGSARGQVTSNFTPLAGSRHLVLHGTRSASVGRSEATLHLDVTGFENVELSFLHRRGTTESAQAMPLTFVDGSNTDGVAYSVDGGTTWKRIVSLTGANSTTTTQPFNFNLSNLATTNGDTLDGVVLVRFQQYDNQPAPARGHFHDSIVVTATPVGEGLPGDVNDDGMVNVADVTTLSLFLNGQIGSVPSLANADFNEDGVVDAEDAAALINFIVNE